MKNPTGLSEISYNNLSFNFAENTWVRTTFHCGKCKSSFNCSFLVVVDGKKSYNYNIICPCCKTYCGDLDGFSPCIPIIQQSFFNWLLGKIRLLML